jgi:Cu/Ag efflux protein CusF
MTRNGKIAAILSLALLSASAGTPASAQSATIDGEVTKVDASAGKITIKHGPIKKLEMDMPMTMVFKAGDPAMLNQVKAGDKIKFDAEKVNGQFTVVKIEPKK